ncbi:TetR family transcriptional regulator [Rhodopirellula maiorica SM1]|uniref:TetR family transcriptional regulator n=1 Tax=Rhodopirellula maiorica SM1 TaxID=1265738 RepID=M5RQJ3_9BACT|nr:TetR/AcrR family transcriptional regulator [Rhodopirellula maiorica]EMI21608.1 TetR family transcriptional regulator [Rhodopirellula maiorica SM1]
MQKTQTTYPAQKVSDGFFQSTLIAVAYRPTGRYCLGMPNTKPLETTTRILDSVMQLILHGGLPAVTLSAVCRKAGISKGGLVHHFPTKEALVEAFLQQSVRDYLDLIQQAAAPHSPGVGKQANAVLDLFFGEPLDDERAESEPVEGEPDASRDCPAVMVALIQGGGCDSLVDEVYQTLFDLMRSDGLSRDLADLILVTLDGIWLRSMITANESMIPRMKRIRSKLNQLIASELAKKTNLHSNTNEQT